MKNSCFHSWSLVLIASLTFHLQNSADKVSRDVHSFCQEAIHLLNSTLKTNKKPTVNSVSRFYKIYLCSSFTDLHLSDLLHLGYMQKLSITCMMSVLLPQISPGFSLSCILKQQAWMVPSLLPLDKLYFQQKKMWRIQLWPPSGSRNNQCMKLLA